MDYRNIYMDRLTDKTFIEFLISYHICEEFLIFIVCLLIAWRALSVSRSLNPSSDRESKSRILLISAGFTLLGINSFVHAFIHAAGVDLNFLYQTLLGYCLGLLTLIIAISSEKPWNKGFVPMLYLPLLILLIPDINIRFPIFAEFRPLVWVVIAYLSGVVCILYMAAYYNTRLKRSLLSALGHMLICISAISLFFPTGIGSSAWVYGHALRPIGFGILFFSMQRVELLSLRESMLYKTLSAFSLLAAIPIMAFGIVVFYENISPIELVGKKIIVFILVLLTLASALVFALTLIIRLIRPLLWLKKNVDRVAEEGLERRIEPSSNDEIGILSHAFNDMIVRLRDSFAERDRLGRLAATGELAATLAHEIKNPLNAISVAATYIGKNFKGSLIKEFVTVINEEASRINKLTSNLLNFAKPLKPEPVPSDINELVKETVTLMNQECEEQGLTIETSLENGIPVTSFDYSQIKQVLINLLLNSFDAVDREGTIKVSTRSGNGKVFLSVEDNGKGIKDEDLENIFYPFFTTKARGTGLGLAISKNVVSENGGDMSVESKLGKGSKFMVAFPVRT